MMDLVRRNSEVTFSENRIFSNHGKLPRVPLPSLQESVTNFEQWCAPLLNHEEFAQTLEALSEFASNTGPGPLLHEALNEFNQHPGVYSWLDAFWPARYLGRRVPVSINANFIMLFKEKALTQTEYASFLVERAVQYKLMLDRELLPAVPHRDKPLCTVQNTYLLSTTRIPGLIRDTVRSPYSESEPGPSEARHILVIHNHRLFRLEVLHEDGSAYDAIAIKAAIQKIMTSTTDKPIIQESVGYLTTMHRAEWAQLRSELLAPELKNAIHLDTIEQALFCLCLDETEPDNLKQAADQLLHGDGGNRWFDKSISLIVTKNGRAGINVEHCGLDGTTVVDFVDFIFDELSTDEQIKIKMEKSVIPASNPISLNLTKKIINSIQTARDDFQKLAKNTATSLFAFEDFGAAHIKSLKVSPDAFVQLGFQLAHFRTKGFVGATYESVSCRHYERGRTEAMRVVTPHVIEFVNSMQDSDYDNHVRAKLLHAAAEQHTLRLRQCQSGKAPEQHLWQLQLIAQERGKELGTEDNFKLFTSPGWIKMRSDFLSTSSAPSENITVFGFGPTSEQCIGIAYLIGKDGISAYLSTPSKVADFMHDFSHNLNQAFREMAQVLEECMK